MRSRSRAGALRHCRSSVTGAACASARGGAEKWHAPATRPSRCDPREQVHARGPPCRHAGTRSALRMRSTTAPSTSCTYPRWRSSAQSSVCASCGRRVRPAVAARLRLASQPSSIAALGRFRRPCPTPIAKPKAAHAGFHQIWKEFCDHYRYKSGSYRSARTSPSNSARGSNAPCVGANEYSSHFGSNPAPARTGADRPDEGAQCRRHDLGGRMGGGLPVCPLRPPESRALESLP